MSRSKKQHVIDLIRQGYSFYEAVEAAGVSDNYSNTLEVDPDVLAARDPIQVPTNQPEGQESVFEKAEEPGEPDDELSEYDKLIYHQLNVALASFGLQNMEERFSMCMHCLLAQTGKLQKATWQTPNGMFVEFNPAQASLKVSKPGRRRPIVLVAYDPDVLDLLEEAFLALEYGL